MWSILKRRVEKRKPSDIDELETMHGEWQKVDIHIVNNGCPRNKEPLNILLTALSKLIRSRLTFFSKDRSYQALQDDICLFF